MNIGRKLIVLVLLCSGVAITILSGISLYNMNVVRHQVVDAGTLLGRSAADDSRNTLIEQAQQQLITLAGEKARYTEVKLKVIQDNVSIIAAEMTQLASNPDAYPARMPAEPDRANTGTITPQLLFSAIVEDKNDPELLREIGAAGNIQDFLVRMNSASDVIASSYIASQNGFVIMADKISDRKFPDATTDVPSPYEAFARPWYIKAEAERKLIFTDLVYDIHGGGLCIIAASPYEANGAFAGVVGMGSYLTEINEIVLSTQIGQSGFGFILNQKGEVTISPKTEGELLADPNNLKDVRLSDNKELAQVATRMTAGESGVVQITLDGKDCYLAFAPLTSVGWSFATVIERDEVIAPALQSESSIITLTNQSVAGMDEQITRVTITMGIAAVLLLAAVAVAGWRLSLRITRPLMVLNEGVKVVSGGKLDYFIDIHTGDEIEMLANSFNKMTRDLLDQMINLKHVTAEKERIGAELDVAKHIQASMLPCIFPAFPERPELDIYATMTPAKEVGGDFYDFFLTDDDHLAMVMADVSGKGVPAALFMVIAKTLLKNVAQTGLTPREVLEKVNNQLCENNEAEMFVTVWLGILEISTGKLTAANAGHEYPVLKKADGDYELIKDKHGFVLAGMEGARYKEYELQMEPGDKLYLYTDGVAEATDAQNELYGTDRMLAALNRCKEAGCEEVLRRVKEDIDLFVGTAPQFDDITMLGIELKKADTGGLKKLMLKPTLEAMDQVTAFVEQELEGAEVPMKIIAQMNIAVDEIFSNIARYARASDATVGCMVKDSTVTLRFADNGSPYDPTEKPDPDTTLSAEERDVGGLGIFMVKKSMDSVEYEYRDGLNILTLTKKLS